VDERSLDLNAVELPSRLEVDLSRVEIMDQGELPALAAIVAHLGISMRDMMSAVDDTPTLDEETWLHGAWCTIDADGWVTGAYQPFRVDVGGRYEHGARRWLAGWGTLADEVPTSEVPSG
jgi:hypothetical protein